MSSILPTNSKVLQCQFAEFYTQWILFKSFPWFIFPVPGLTALFIHSVARFWRWWFDELPPPPSWWGATVATYCLSRQGTSLNPHLQNLATEWMNSAVFFPTCMTFPEAPLPLYGLIGLTLCALNPNLAPLCALVTDNWFRGSSICPNYRGRGRVGEAHSLDPLSLLKARASVLGRRIFVLGMRIFRVTLSI